MKSLAKLSTILACLSALAASPAPADPISLVGAMPAGSPQYSLFLIDASRLRDQTFAEAKAHLESQLAPLGLLPSYVNTDLNATPIHCGKMHFGVNQFYSYDRETQIPTVESPPTSLTLDRGVKNVFGVNFRTPEQITDPFDAGHVVHVHFDEPMRQFGMLVNATAAAGGMLIVDVLRFEAQTDVDGDGLPETVAIERAMNVDTVEFVGIEVPTGFTDVTIIPLGGATQAYVADRYSYAAMPAATPAAGPGGAAFSFAPPSPNPSSGAVQLRFALPAAGEAAAEVYGLDGRHVRTLLRGPAPEGAGAVWWDGRTEAGAPAPAGVYFLRLEQGGRSLVHRVALVR